MAGVLSRLALILGRPLCVLTVHRREELWVTGGGPIQSLFGPFGRVFVEIYNCERCRVLVVKRVRRKPAASAAMRRDARRNTARGVK